MAKYFLATICLLFGLTMVLPLTVLAAYNTVTFTADTNLSLETSGITLTVSNGSMVESLVVYGTYISLDLKDGSSITITCPDRKVLTVSPVLAESVCATDSSYVIINANATYAGVTVTPGDTCTVTPTGTTGGAAPAAPAQPPQISDVESTVTSTIATITWTTDKSATSKVNYGLTTSYGETVSSTGLVTSHSLTLTELSSETTYHYQIQSTASGVTGSYSDKTFTTLAVAVIGEETVTASEGGEVTATSGEGGTATVTFPADAVTSDTTITVTPVGTAESIAGDPPAGSFMVGGYVYTISAISAGEAVTTFSEEVTLTFTYTDAQVSGFDESTLTVYRWDADSSQWIALSSTVNTETNTVTATTTEFSEFALMGEKVVEEEEEVKPISEMTIAELKAEIVRIAALIAQLQAELAKLIGVAETIDVNLKYDDRGDDVELLQTWLAKDSEVYPEGLVTGWFGPLTKAAVIRFQEKYASDILTPWGITKGTGFVGSTTRDKLNVLYGGK